MPLTKMTQRRASGLFSGAGLSVGAHGRLAFVGKLVVSASVDAQRFIQCTCLSRNLQRFPLEAVGSAIHSGQQGWLGWVKNGFSKNIAEIVQAQAPDLPA
jgi:hypothetical protein